MKFSEQWLREWVNISLTTDEISQRLTMAGLEVDGLDCVAADFSDVVVARIVEIEQHPNADKLRVCRVNFGDEEIQVVCGAPNASVDMIAPFARVGAVIGKDFKIKKAKLRGVESYGMLCSAQELGLAEQSTGLYALPEDAPIGMNLRDYLKLNDRMFELGLTPNRADCLSIRGVARELSAIADLELNEVEVKVKQTSVVSDNILPVSITATKECPRYVGRIIRNINADAITPLWMQEKLRRSGLRCIHPVVDITNFVMIELGQPMHAFDLDKLSDSIHVRLANQNEMLTLLDGQEVKLSPDFLVITDKRGPVALAGIMGGDSTAVSDETSHIFLESAFFAPEFMMGKARKLGLHTDSSHRFERGVDFALQNKAIERATELLLSIVGGEAGPINETCCDDDLPRQATVLLRKQRIEQLLGCDIPKKEVNNILQKLGMESLAKNDTWEVVPPSWRFDIAIEDDLVEEIARIYGYDRIPSRFTSGRLQRPQLAEAVLPRQQLRSVLTNLAYFEAINYSFVADDLLTLFGYENILHLDNPLTAELSAMRPSLIPGLLQTLKHNVNRQVNRVRLFELGSCFLAADAGQYIEKERLAGVVLGSDLTYLPFPTQPHDLFCYFTSSQY